MSNCTVCVRDDWDDVVVPCARCMAEEQAELDAEYAEAGYDDMTAAEFYGEMLAAQYDCDPNPYHGTY